MRIEVTEDDVRNGKRFDCSLCPVALAINRVLPPGMRAELFTTVCYLYRDDKWLRSFGMPSAAAAWIARFDLRREPEPEPKPFAFELPIEELVEAHV